MRNNPRLRAQKYARFIAPVISSSSQIHPPARWTGSSARSARLMSVWMSAVSPLQRRDGLRVEIVLEVEHVVVELREHGRHAMLGGDERGVQLIVTFAAYRKLRRLASRNDGVLISPISFSHSANMSVETASTERMRPRTVSACKRNHHIRFSTCGKLFPPRRHRTA